MESNNGSLDVSLAVLTITFVVATLASPPVLPGVLSGDGKGACVGILLRTGVVDLAWNRSMLVSVIEQVAIDRPHILSRAKFLQENVKFLKIIFLVEITWGYSRGGVGTSVKRRQ